jgi:hypothetical protein
VLNDAGPREAAGAQEMGYVSSGKSVIHHVA